MNALKVSFGSIAALADGISTLTLFFLYREPCPCPQFFRLALQLPAGRQNVAPARRAHGARIASIEHDIGKFFDSIPVRTFIRRAGPGIERNEIDLGRN